MIGMLLGGIFWGMLGDKRGRLSTLFGSIALYSVANIANAFVHTAGSYMVWRFMAGFGLAGELGAAITLVSEILPRELRGYGTTIVAAVGIFGTVVAALVGKDLPWRTGYLVGGAWGCACWCCGSASGKARMFKQMDAGQGLARQLPPAVHHARARRPLPALHPHRPAHLVHGRHPHQFLAPNSGPSWA